MKKLLLFVIACTLGLFGTVSAQTTVTMGDGSASEMYSPPIDIYYANGFSQQIFPASSLGIPSGSVISNIAFKHAGGSSPTRTWSIYMQNSQAGVFVYPEYTVSSKPVESSDKVYSGTFTVPSEENVWVPFDLTEPFTYEGGDLILTVIDNTGASGGDHWWINSFGFGHSIHGGRDAAYNEGSDYSFNQRYDYTSDIQITYTAGEGGGEEPTPEPGDDLASEFSFDFEDGTLTGLKVFQGEGATGNNWQVTADGDTYYAGQANSKGIYSVSWDENSYTQFYPNNYVVTEQAYQITENSVLSWFMRYTYLQYGEFDKYEVVASEDGTNFDMVLWEGDGTSPNSNTLSLAEYAGKALYLGFRHYAESDPGDALVLDNIVLSAGEGGGEEPTPEPEPETPTVDLTKQYRVKATSLDKYLYVMDNDAHATGPQGGVVVYQTMNDNAQLFTLEDAGDGAYYFKSATGYYIYCQAWNVDAYSTTEKTALKMVDQGDGTFRLQNTNNNKYFKVQQVGMFYFPFCDCDGVDCTIETWTLEAVEGGNEEPEPTPEPTPVAPTAPVVEATVTETTVTLTWAAVENATYYNIYTPSTFAENILGLEETTYTFEGLTAGTEYCFEVSAGNDVDESDATEACATTTEAEIEEPTGDLCVIDITLEDSYGDGWNGNILKVEYGTTSKEFTLSNGKTTTETMEIPSGSHVTATFICTNAYGYPQENGFTIAYESGEVIVSVEKNTYAMNTPVTQAYEFDVDCTPKAPATPVVKAVATGGSTIALTITSAGAESYDIYNGTETVATGVTENPYTVEGLTASTEYCFTVVAVNEVGSSEASEEVCATTFAEGTVIVSIGEGDIAQMSAPIYNAGPGDKPVYSLSQQIYTAEEIGIDGNADIHSISFHHATGNNNVRDIIVYMQNVDADAYTDNKGWFAFSESDKVYEGEFNFGMAEDWVTIDFQNKFEYKGGNVAVTVYDKTGIAYGYTYDICDKFYSSQVNEWRGLYYTKQAEMDFSQLSTFYGTTMNTGNYGSPANVYYINNIKLRALETAGEEPTPEPVVGNYRLEAINHTQDWNNVSYVYESETSDKVVEIKNGGYSTFLQYDANGVLTGYEYGWVENGAIDKESYSAQFTIVEYTYSGDKLASYKESEYFGWYSTEEPQTETEYTFAYNAEGQVETVEFGDSKIVYTYENGKLASETKSYYDEWAEIPGYKTEYIVEYAYDENGNCTTATQYSAYDGEKIARKATEYNYELTIPAANVTAFAYPHEVAPAHANLITRAISYEFQEDWETGETYTTNYIVQKYVYNPEVLAAPLAPMGLTARAISDTEVELNWTAAEAAESFKIYSGETVVAENITETTYKVTGLTSSTEYCYTVVGVNGGVESPASEPACVTTNDLVAIYPATIEFGTVRVGNYWAAKETTAEVEINRLGKVITSITTDNAVFTVPADLDMTSDYIYFELGYDKATIEAGEYAATLIVTLEGGATVTAPITATAYAPVTPDVFELAQEITFTEGVYTNTPDSTTLHDDYLMPEEYEWEDGNLLDAVYTFSLEIPAAVKVNVTGEKAQYAIYKAEGFEYPTEETFNGVDRAMTTEFSFDFNDGELGAFTIQDNDEFKDYTWKVEEGALTSYSFNGWYDENNQWVYINDADERIITSEAYNITEKSVLTFDMNVNGNFEGVIVEVTKDGETFIEIENILETSYSWDWLAKRISIGEIFAEKGLEYGEYQISLYHDMPGYGELNIDNLVLAERELAFPEGTYYLFVAAEKDLAVEVTAVETEEVVIVPEPKAYRLEGVESFISTEYTYDELFTNRVVTMVKEGITSTFAYNKAGQLETIVDTSEGEDEEGNPTSDTINIVKYKYNQDGTIATHSEATAGWEPMVTDFVYEGGKLVKTVIADYEMEVTLAYNAEGLLSEKVTSYSGEIDSKEVYTYDAEGRLVDYGYYGYDAWDLLDYYLAEGITYKYDANGNCVSAESYLVFDGEKSYYQTAKYFYDEKIANEDVYTFDLPHVAMTNVAPAQVNVLVKELSYYTEYDDNGEAHNHTYDVTVYSYNPAIEVAPIAPMNLVAEVVDGVVELTWEAFADAETFVVYQDGEAIAENVEVGAYTVEGLEAGEYSFAVQAVNAVGRSMVTEEVEVTIEGSEPIVPEPTVPAAPVVEVVEVTETTIVFAWAPVEGATKYNVYAYGELAGSTPDTIAGFKDLEPNTEYCFTVTAVNEVGESVPSEEVCATTKPDAIAENAAAFNIYPNPVADRLFIETEANVEEVTIYTLTGVMVYSEVDFNNNSINVSELNGGVYIMKVRTENGEAVRRFIKK